MQIEYAGSLLEESLNDPAKVGTTEKLDVVVGWRTHCEGANAITFTRGGHGGIMVSPWNVAVRAEVSDWHPFSGERSKFTTCSVVGVEMTVGKSLHCPLARKVTLRASVSEAVKNILPDFVSSWQETLQGRKA